MRQFIADALINNSLLNIGLNIASIVITLIIALILIPKIKQWKQDRREMASHSLLLANIASKYSQDAKIISDINGKILYFNSAAERMFGRTKLEMLNNTILPLIPEKYRAKHLLGMEKFRAEGVSNVIGSVMNVEGVNKKGEEFPIEMSIFCDLSLDGNPLIVAVIKDRTPILNLEQLVKEDVKVLEQYEEIADIGGWEWDIKSKMVTVTKNFKAIFELNGGIPTSDYLMKRIYKDDEERVALAIGAAFDNPVNKDYVVRYRIKRKNDEIINIECIAKAIYEHGEHTKYRGTVRIINDIT